MNIGGGKSKIVLYGEFSWLKNAKPLKSINCIFTCGTNDELINTLILPIPKPSNCI